MPSPAENQVRLLYFAPGVLIDLLKGPRLVEGRDGCLLVQSPKIDPPLPHDAEFRAVNWDHQKRAFCVTMASATFSYVKHGDQIPQWGTPIVIMHNVPVLGLPAIDNTFVDALKRMPVDPSLRLNRWDDDLKSEKCEPPSSGVSKAASESWRDRPPLLW